MGTISLDAAQAQLDQALRDFGEAHADAMARDPICRSLAVSTALSAMRYVERHGLTPTGRKQLRTGIEALRHALGLEERQ
jgi:hypothetical protein